MHSQKFSGLETNPHVWPEGQHRETGSGPDKRSGSEGEGTAADRSGGEGPGTGKQLHWVEAARGEGVKPGQVRQEHRGVQGLSVSWSGGCGQASPENEPEE